MPVRKGPPGFLVIILARISEGVRINCSNALLIAKSIISVGLRNCSRAVSKLHHISVRVEQIPAVVIAFQETDAADITGR